ncbi:nuclear transport factor 2 family protein [Mycolicibacterium sp. XJ1819]
MSESVANDAIALYNNWLEAWRRVDGEAMKRLWDQAYPSLIYQAEERAETFTSWVAIENYWNTAPEHVEKITGVQDLGHTLCEFDGGVLLFGTITIAFHVKDAPKPLEGQMRVTMGMHRVGGEVKLFHYHESRQLDLEAALQ